MRCARDEEVAARQLGHGDFAGDGFIPELQKETKEDSPKGKNDQS